jgi:hypothetical protein
MHNPAANLLAFAVNEERLRGMASGFQGKRASADVPELIFWLAILAALALCVWFASRWLYRSDRPMPYSNPRRLFRLLCRAHHLGAADRRVFARLAQQHGLLNPARLFLEPERFDMSTAPGNSPLAAGAVAAGSGLNSFSASWPSLQTASPCRATLAS